MAVLLTSKKAYHHLPMRFPDFAKTLGSRILYFADVMDGRLRGLQCPNCKRPGSDNKEVAQKQAGLVPILECSQCGLLYRPVGIVSNNLLEFYYSHLYGAAGIATRPAMDFEADETRLNIHTESKDRSPILKMLCGDRLRPPARVCVLGASWGYEMLLFQKAGFDVVGVEIGSARREFGRQRYGLKIFPSVAEAAAHVGHSDILFSSHVLEHIPGVSAFLSEAHDELHPTVHLHFFPGVEPLEPNVSAIGREHPIGLTTKFWKEFSAQHQLSLNLYRGEEIGGAAGESAVFLAGSTD